MVFSWHLGWAAGSQMALLLDLLSKKGRLDLLSKKGRRKDLSIDPNSSLLKNGRSKGLAERGVPALRSITRHIYI